MPNGPRPTLVSLATEVAVLKQRMNESAEDRVDLHRWQTEHSGLDDARFEQLRQDLLKRPSWSVSAYMTLVTSLLMATIGAIVTYVASH